MVRVGIDLFYKVLYETKIVVGDDYDGNSRHSTAEKKKTSKKKRNTSCWSPLLRMRWVDKSFAQKAP